MTIEVTMIMMKNENEGEKNNWSVQMYDTYDVR
jgi:hypothetical protein